MKGADSGKSDYVRFFSERCRHEIIYALVYIYFLILSTPMLLLDHRIYHIKCIKWCGPNCMVVPIGSNPWFRIVGFAIIN